jgi:uncharacterized protein (TIGR02996 family)
MTSPENPAAAMRLLSRGAWLEAEAAAQALIAAAPAEPHGPLILGLAIAAMGEPGRAAPILNHAAALQPHADHPCLDLARLQPNLPRGLVTRQFRACLRLNGSDDRLRLAFADFLLDHDQPAEAETVLADGPASAVSQHLMGQARAEQNDFPAAIACFRAAVTLDPNAAASWSNLGMVLKVEGQFAEAIAAHDRALALQPTNPRLSVNRAVTLLKAGHWQRAWLDYEARLALAGAPTIDMNRLLPSLQLGDTLHGRTVLAMHEDGFGDTLNFLRYLPMLADRGASIVACVPPALVRILRMVPGVQQVLSDASDLPPYDFVCPMFSLPRVFGTTVDTIPPVPTIALDNELAQRWAARLPAHGLRVGLVWAGQARPSIPGFQTLDRRRSAGLAAFAPLFDLSGIIFVSLQAGPAGRQPRPAGMRTLDLMQDVVDFADTAAIIAGLDVVVSVDTSVAHLAGLIGKPVLLMDRYDGCWRWLSDRTDTPWYPGMTIFRQDRPGDWSGAMARAAASLHAMTIPQTADPTSNAIREHAFIA